MIKLKARDIAIAALLASLWGILNLTASPIFFNITHLPILCDMLGVTSLVVSIWLSKKLTWSRKLNWSDCDHSNSCIKARSFLLLRVPSCKYNV